MDLSKILDWTYRITDDKVSRAMHTTKLMLKDVGLSESDINHLIEAVAKSIPNLTGYNRRFYPGIIRWMLEDQLDITDPNQCVKVSRILRVIPNSPAEDFFTDNNFQNLSMDEVMDILFIEDKDEAELTDSPYKVVPINKFSDLYPYRRYASEWCIMNDEEEYERHLMDGAVHFYLLIHPDYKNIPAVPGDKYPKDSYGKSLIAVGVDSDSNIVSVTSRWNYGDTLHDNFMSDEELKELLGTSYNLLK